MAGALGMKLETLFTIVGGIALGVTVVLAAALFGIAMAPAPQPPESWRLLKVCTMDNIYTDARGQRWLWDRLDSEPFKHAQAIEPQAALEDVCR